VQKAKHRIGSRVGEIPLAKIIAAVIIVLAAIFTVYFISQPGVTAITDTKTVSIQANKTIYLNLFNKIVALRLQNAYNASATFYATETPILYGPISVFSLAPGSSANVSSSGSGFADMNIKLISSGGSSASVEITPLASSLGIRASFGISVLNPANFGGAGAGTTATTTTSISTTSTTATTTVQDTTAIHKQQALTVANNSQTGLLMASYKALYKKDVRCNSTAYNATYLLYHIGPIPGPNSFASVRQFVPTDITASASQLGSQNTYKVTYSTTSPSAQTTGPAVTLNVNIASNTISNVTFTGVFLGNDYAALNDAYLFQNGITGSFCGAYISPT